MRKILTILVISVFLTQCGFSVMNTDISKFNIQNVEAEGYKKVNFLIKNDLINKHNNQGTKNISLKIKTTRKKEIAEKNIKNQITKYKISISSEVRIILPGETKDVTINLSKNGNYRVGSTSLITSRNLENLEKNLAKEIVKEIKQKLLIISNDL